MRAQDNDTNLIEIPRIKQHANESPDDPDEEKRTAFYKHKNHFFVLTIAGKPIFTKHYPLSPIDIAMYIV